MGEYNRRQKESDYRETQKICVPGVPIIQCTGREKKVDVVIVVVIWRFLIAVDPGEFLEQGHPKECAGRQT